jgi:hypothetical protein
MGDIERAWQTARLYRCTDCMEPARVMTLTGTIHVVTRVHHSWCRTGQYIRNNHSALRRPDYEDLRIAS